MTAAQASENFGSTPPLRIISNRGTSSELTRVSSKLDYQDLQALLEGDIAILRIPKFYSQKLCKKYASKMIEDDRISAYQNPGAEQVNRIGLSYFETYENPMLYEQYYQQALPNIRQSRNLFLPNLSPMDQLRLELEEVWPGGATLENIEGKTMSVGLSRVLKTNAEILPHLDVLQWDAPKCLRANELKTQLAGNVFLQVAEGGELELWCQKMSRQEYEMMKIPGSYGIDRKLLGNPDVTIQPEVGDLILFQSTYVHAVKPVTAGVRVTMSCFIGYRSANQFLSYWS
ncbi:conserved hypothetical protein [Limnospira maxima CS-328]|uniref:Fe2OG dioxygenase domain-containing protein n=2 Tax=Limnospira TaxID=2596745 RepID=B5W777_LIMMA|nr:MULTISPECIES: 2OG-Fe(II) oxygenase [Limnospira]EDZ92624.1 conserved hypothetical protein [Limnospira maxima CS-328]MDC0838654.1 2OG-Fe(II) oxygenase [Limnoraphis robusta]MDT9272974.1 2OG-Fe(II) oxygenase [Limnospira sp. PMC 737.11]RAQ46740.1 hypothetical protein B9S53_06035 [Arthrospira sp. O9.13F]